MSDDFSERPFAKRGALIERLGRLMQDPDTTMEQLIKAGQDAGLHIGFGLMVEGRPAQSLREVRAEAAEACLTRIDQFATEKQDCMDEIHSFAGEIRSGER